MPWYIAARDKLDALKNHPCVDCGVKYMPAVMEFDHVRGEKKFMINMKTIKRPDLEEELAKCELRCANCHRTRHALVAAERQEARLAS